MRSPWPRDPRPAGRLARVVGTADDDDPAGLASSSSAAGGRCEVIAIEDRTAASGFPDEAPPVKGVLVERFDVGDFLRRLADGMRLRSADVDDPALELDELDMAQHVDVERSVAVMLEHGGDYRGFYIVRFSHSDHTRVYRVWRVGDMEPVVEPVDEDTAGWLFDEVASFAARALGKTAVS